MFKGLAVFAAVLGAVTVLASHLPGGGGDEQLAAGVVQLMGSAAFYVFHRTGQSDKKQD